MRKENKAFPHRTASNNVTLDGTALGLYVVEADSEGRVEAYYPLDEELPFTEWTAEPIELATGRDGQIWVRQRQ